jgi:hypothetical protein
MEMVSVVFVFYIQVKSHIFRRNICCSQSDLPLNPPRVQALPRLPPLFRLLILRHPRHLPVIASTTTIIHPPRQSHRLAMTGEHRTRFVFSSL